MRIPPVNPKAVFLNIPYDEEFRELYVAYVVGLSQIGLEPHITTEIPGGQRRLDRILRLVQTCRYSIHDLSRVELSPTPPATPRFNMPLELGLSIAWAAVHPERHTWFLWETVPHRASKSISDLNGTDPYIHDGKVGGVLSELLNAFVDRGCPTVLQMMEAYRLVESNFQSILENAGTTNFFSASVFKALCFVSLDFAIRRSN